MVRRAFVLSASGLTDREVAAALGLRVTQLREILTNPAYLGQLRTGEASGGPALIPAALWDQTMLVRSRYAPDEIGVRCPSGPTRSRRFSRAPRALVA